MKTFSTINDDLVTSRVLSKHEGTSSFDLGDKVTSKTTETKTVSLQVMSESVNDSAGLVMLSVGTQTNSCSLEVLSS